ncbi:hypothetical protein EPUS_05725 [Endocarpon pusillum Z07020]|uniref:Uncharacterized protein n=1 Tax=Endocarpon pusillum (strain Z07020 / HMAS-L-300199) TaxID=1263415 RepID=U1HIH0_ENDPU|nr:uncharacterized protein EPUS_05725 [Endocarpon pusillum Z07020]ERF68664.1 hypothetical protein EPUS_05725 [Endocarpon pusillum Z07020]
MDCSADGLLSNLELVLHAHGVKGLQDRLRHLASLRSLPLGNFTLASDRDRSALVSAVALRAQAAMGNSDQDLFETSLHCLSVILSFISMGKVELWSEGEPLPDELDMIRKTYMNSLQGSHFTTWPSYFVVFRLAYPSMTEFWVKWLHEASLGLETPSSTNLCTSFLECLFDQSSECQKSLGGLTLSHPSPNIRHQFVRIASGLMKKLSFKKVAGFCCMQGEVGVREKKPVHS